MNNNRSKIISISAAVITMLIGITVIIGWLTHNNFLREISPGQVRMTFNIALGFVLSSIVLLLYHFTEKNKTRHFVSALLSVTVSFIGLLTLIEYIFDFNAGIDELFFKDELPTTAIYYAGRMSPLSAINFIFIGIGLLLLNKEKTATYQFFYLAGIVFVSLLMLISFNFISNIPAFIRLGIHVSLGFFTLPAAIYFAQPMLQKKISFERKIFTGFTAVITLIALLSIFSSYYSDKRISTSQLVNHTNNVLSEAEQVLSLTRDIESGGRGYVITGDSGYLEYFTLAKGNIFNHVKKLKELTKDKPDQQARIDSLSELIDERISFSLQCIQARNEKGFEAANELISTRQSKFYTDKIRNVTSEIQKQENDLLSQRQKENDKSIVLLNRAFFIFLGSVFILFVIILFSIRNNIAVRKKAEKQRRENEESLVKLNNELEQRVKERTEEIFENERKYRHLFENNPMPMWVIDLNTFKFLDVNEMAILQYGYSREEFLSMTTLDIRPDEGKELFKQPEHLFEMGRTNYSKGIWNHRKKDGTIIQVETIGHKISFEGVPARLILSNDVTEKKKAEEKLEQSEKLFRAMIEKDADMKTLATPDGKVFYASPSITKILGYENEEFMTTPAFELIHPDDVPDLIEGVTDIIQTPGKSYYHQQRLKHKNGTWLWCEGTITNMLHEPAVGALVSNFRDITERKKFEEAQTLFASIVNSSDDAIFSRSLDGIITSWNHGAEKAFGYSSNEIIGKYNSILIPSHLQNEENEIMEKIHEGEVVDRHETERIKKDGKVMYVSQTISPIKDSLGNIIGASKISRDITERKKAEDLLIKSEKQYRNLFENNPMPMWVFNLTTFKFLDVNEATISHYGYSREEFLSMTALDIRSDEDKELFKKVDHSASVSPTEYNRGIWKHLKKDGTMIYVEIIVHEIIFEGESAHLVLSNDVTKRILVEKEIQKLNEELENRVKQRTEELEAFSYSVSHDLRSPLRAVSGYAKMLEEDYNKVFDKEGNRLLGVIQENANKMGILIDDLLAFSRLGKKEVNGSFINMTQLTESILSEINKTISNKTKVKINPLYPAMADYSLINQVMMNLISNAIKYSSGTEKPAIEIRSEKKDGELIYSISDNGAGFDMQYAHKLFGVFQRLHSAEEFEGTGIGLAIVKRIINKHNGRVWAEGEPGQGATFYFSLPAGQAGLPDYETIKNN